MKLLRVDRDEHRVRYTAAPGKGYRGYCTCGLEGAPGDNTNEAWNALVKVHADHGMLLPRL